MPARAEPVIDRALSGVRLLTSPSCVVVKIEFNLRIRYASHFPTETGDELRISVRAIDPGEAAALAIVRREALRAPDSALASIKAIDFEADQPNGPILRIQFHHPVFYQVAQGPDFESIVIAVSGKRPRAGCKPVFPSRLGWDATVSSEGPAPGTSPQSQPAPAPVVRPKDRPGGQLTEAELRAVAASMDEARAAIRKSRFVQAVRLLADVLGKPENEYSTEAQELLGVAYQKNGQLAEARSQYEDYLRRYPSNEGTARVRQRLDGILTAAGEPAETLRAARGQSAGPGAEGAKPTSWVVSGSASQFYIRDDSYRTLRDPSLPPDPNEDPEDHRVHQNAVLSSFDLIAAMNSDQFKSNSASPLPRSTTSTTMTRTSSAWQRCSSRSPPGNWMS